MKSQLQVYARLKPSESYGIVYDIDKQRKTLIIGQKQTRTGFVNNMKETIEFNLTDVLDCSATQEQVFNQVAVPVVLNCLDGYNGTVFAYGQTGSGKTYTINGSDSWAERGIIPRVMTYIFDKIDERKKEYSYTVYASYMEIYNEKAYDLLNEDHLVSPLDQWNKIEFKRDNLGNIHLSNISLHEIDDAKPGIDLLMMGNYIRKQAATPMNQCSSRSHCIFTLTFEARQLENDTCFVSKLNLVDLAGSERVSKTNHDGTLLTEAKNINLSLSFLEQVIVALNEKKRTGLRQHIPYRHSILTTILKDSLGGNCKTVMIANISTEMDNFEETISALRFSQRVGQLENEIHRNEKVDLSAQVQKLEEEKLQLLDELQKYQRIVGDMKDLRESEQQQQQQQQQQQKQQQQKQKRPFKHYEQEQIEQWEEEEYEEQGDTEGADLDSILNKVDDYMTEKTDQLDVANIVEARLCFRAMKEYHKLTMADYLRELSDISKKLQQYDALLPPKKQIDQLQQLQQQQQAGQIQDSEITQMALNNFYCDPKNSLRSSSLSNGQDENIDPVYGSDQSAAQAQTKMYEFTLKPDELTRNNFGNGQARNNATSNNVPSQNQGGIEVNLYKQQQQQQQQQQKRIQPLSRSKNENTQSSLQQAPSGLLNQASRQVYQS